MPSKDYSKTKWYKLKEGVDTSVLKAPYEKAVKEELTGKWPSFTRELLDSVRYDNGTVTVTFPEIDQGVAGNVSVELGFLYRLKEEDNASWYYPARGHRWEPREVFTVDIPEGTVVGNASVCIYYKGYLMGMRQIKDVFPEPMIFKSGM